MLLDELMVRNKQGSVRRKTFKHGSSLARYARRFNTKSDVYQSVYTFTGTCKKDDKTRPCNPIVDKIYLDFDVKDDPNFPDYAQRVAKYLHDNDIAFYIRFSGRGFHIFIQLEQQELKNPRVAIRNWVATLHKDTDTISDPSVVGDLTRVSRLLHFVNLKSGRYCIPIRYDELMDLPYESICQIAENDREEDDFLNGHVLVDITEFDAAPIAMPVKKRVQYDDIEIRDDIVDTFPPCVKAFLSDPNLGHSDRIQLILFLRDVGYSEEEIVAVLEKFLSEEKFRHSVFEEEQVSRFYTNYEYFFKSCHAHKKAGTCVSDTCEGYDMYF